MNFLHGGLFHSLADSGMPRDISATQTMDSAGNCTLSVTWKTPSDTMISDVTGYTVYISGTPEMIIPNNDNATSMSTTYSTCGHCSSHNISVKAINRCNRTGVSTPIVTLDSENVSNATCNTINGPGENMNEFTTYSLVISQFLLIRYQISFHNIWCDIFIITIIIIHFNTQHQHNDWGISGKKEANPSK